MKSQILKIAVFGLLCCAACNSPSEEVRKEEAEARKEVGAAQANVEKTEQRAAEKIHDARMSGDSAKVEEQKIEATEDIAEAKEELGDEKVEATEEVTEAKKDAGQTTGTFQQE